MDILLINPPGKISFISPPLGLLYIASSLKKDRHNVFLMDYNLEKYDTQKISNFIKEKNIEVVGISIVTPKVYNAMELAKNIKLVAPQVILVAGGPHATLDSEGLLNQCPEIDYVLKGEGEIRMREFVKNFNNHEMLKKLDGLTYREDNKIIINPTINFIEDLDTLPMPERDLLDINKYGSFLKTSSLPATTIMTSRGCPFQCIYCSKPVTGTRVRSISPENVIKELEYLKNKYGIKEVIFYDDTFTVNRERAMRICDMIIEKKINIIWQCETRVNLVDEELLKRMREAGCYLIAYGIESGNNRVLQVLKKGTTTEQVKKAIDITKKSGIQTMGYFMLGIPTETEKEIEQTIRISKELGVDFAQFSIATAYPGTELYDIAKKENKLTEDWSKSIYAFGGKPTISLSEVPIDKLYSYMKKAYNSFYFRPSYIIRRILELRTPRDFFYALRSLKTLAKETILP